MTEYELIESLLIKSYSAQYATGLNNVLNLGRAIYKDRHNEIKISKLEEFSRTVIKMYTVTNKLP